MPIVARPSRTRPLPFATALWVCSAAACGEPRETGGEGEEVGESGVLSQGTAAPSSSDSGEGSGTDAGSGGASPRLDVEDEATGTGVAPSCEVRVDDMNAVGTCRNSAPPDSFEPDIQWSYTGPDEGRFSLVIPLVANFTDDNGDGAIDLCDTPDVLVAAHRDLEVPGHLYLLNGEDGSTHFRFERVVQSRTTPALGDIDGDGLVEVVTFEETAEGPKLIAFNHDGSVLWDGGETTPSHFINSAAPALALADIDEDGDVEIIMDTKVVDHEGVLAWSNPYQDFRRGMDMRSSNAPIVVNLDGQPGMEVMFGPVAYHADGTLYWNATELTAGFAQVAELDGDGLPEVVLTTSGGFSVLEHDGTYKLRDLTPTGDEAMGNTWRRPATIHDFDGDGEVEFALSSQNNYAAYKADGSLLWTAVVDDTTGLAAGTAFDFLGDGVAEALYGDESRSMIFDGGSGSVVLDTPRTSVTLIEYPVVADIDNDGSAEILVTSAAPRGFGQGNPAADYTVQAVRDVDDRWIQARRIWNQHTYHVTNVSEDGRIPQVEPPHWESINTFRTNVQIEDGGLCTPPPQG